MGNSKKSASLSSVSCSNKFLNLRMSQDTAEEVRSPGDGLGLAVGM